MSHPMKAIDTEVMNWNVPHVKLSLHWGLQQCTTVLSVTGRGSRGEDADGPGAYDNGDECEEGVGTYDIGVGMEGNGTAGVCIVGNGTRFVSIRSGTRSSFSSLGTSVGEK